MSPALAVRDEAAGDGPAIAALHAAAFAPIPYSDGSEPAIVARLRAAGDLALSLVAVEGGAVVGHAAFSPVEISDGSAGWFGLGPVAAAPARQRAGIGTALITAGLERLRARGAGGCVVLGDPAYYGRFGFRALAQLRYPGPPPAAFQALVLAGAAPAGIVRYAAAFG